MLRHLQRRRSELEDTARALYDEVFDCLRTHHGIFRCAIPLIASENVPSPAVREALATDFGNRYAEGWVGERVYAGCSMIDRVEKICINAFRKLYEAEFVDPRPISGVMANLVAFTAFTDHGDTVMALPITCGGHMSVGPKRLGGAAGAVMGLDVEYLPFDHDELNIDVDTTIKKLKRLESEGKHVKMAVFGASVFPFPHPLKELREAFYDYGVKACYDAAHVAGLIAGKRFQDPLREGADIVTLSTHKTLFGPQHGAVLSWDRYAEDIKRATMPGLVSNHHLHALAGVAVALTEMMAFGEEYASQVVRNARALGQALHEQGFKVLGERKGFTESHTLLLDVTGNGCGAYVERTLEESGIIVNRNLLPWDIREGRHYKDPGGIRLGVSEVTRIGFNENTLREVAELIHRSVIKKEDPEQVRKDVEALRKDYQKVHYCYENRRNAYEYVTLR